MAELRKFQKINTRNIGVYSKHSEEMLKPALERIISDLQERRTKKQIKSDSEVITTIAFNQNKVINDLAAALAKFEE